MFLSSVHSLWRLLRAGLVLGAGLVALPALAVLPIESWTTASGARVLFVRADAIPMLDLQIDFDAGGRLVAPERLGLASMVNAMLALCAHRRGPRRRRGR